MREYAILFLLMVVGMSMVIGEQAMMVVGAVVGLAMIYILLRPNTRLKSKESEDR